MSDAVRMSSQHNIKTPNQSLQQTAEHDSVLGLHSYLIFDDIAPRAHLKHHDFPAIGAVSGFLLGLVGTMLIH